MSKGQLKGAVELVIRPNTQVTTLPVSALIMPGSGIGVGWCRPPTGDQGPVGAAREADRGFGTRGSPEGVASVTVAASGRRPDQPGHGRHGPGRRPQAAWCRRPKSPWWSTGPVRLLGDTFFQDRRDTQLARTRGGFPVLPLCVVARRPQGRSSSLRCGRSTLTPPRRRRRSALRKPIPYCRSETRGS